MSNSTLTGSDLTDWIVKRAPKNGGYVRNPEDEVSIQDIAARDPTAFIRDPESFLASH
jgi:hypothetical protein